MTGVFYVWSHLENSLIISGVTMNVRRNTKTNESTNVVM